MTRASPSSLRLSAYAAALTVGSAASMVVEIAAGRLIAPYVGMSLYTWTAIIAVVLGGLSLGHWIGGRLAAPGVTTRGLGLRTGAAFLAAGLATLAVLPALHGAAALVLPLGLNPMAAVAAVTTLAFLAPSLAAGVVSPLLTKMAIDAAPDDAGRILGRMYALGAAGAIAGTVLAGFVFIGWVGSRGTILATAAVYGLLALGFLPLRSRRAVPVAGVVLGLSGMVAAWGAHGRAFESPCTIESSYYCIRIDDFAAISGRPSAVMALDHMAHGVNDRDDGGLIYSQYIQFVDEVAARRHPGPALDAYFVGGGALTLPRAWLGSRPGLRAVVAEIDPAVTRAAHDLMWVPENDPRLSIHARDGRALLQSLPAEPTFDVVFGDAFHDFTMPAHLATREFHDAIAARLRPGGFYAMNVIESRHAPEFLRALVKTLKLSFASVEVWLEDEDARSGSRVTYVVLAGDTPLPVHVLDAARGLERRWWRVPEAVLGSLEASPVLTDDFAPVDRLMGHVTLNEALAD